MAERGRELDSLDAKDLHVGAERLTAGEWVVIYGIGASAALTVYQQDGWPGVEALLLSRPTSSEQVLHPEKLGRDTPSAIDPPTIEGASLLDHTVVGELSISLLLMAQGVSDEDAFVTSQGWDGDCLATYDWGGAELVVWRTLWDRPEDALQFDTAVRAIPTRSKSASIERRGNVVDIIMAPALDALGDAVEIARSLPTLGSPPAMDAELAAAVEKRFREDIEASVRIERGYASFEGGLVRVPILDGWGFRRIKGTPILFAPAQDGFADNVTVIIRTNALGETLDKVETDMRRDLGRVPGIELLALRRRTIGGRQIVWSELQGTWPGSNGHVHQIGVTALIGNKSITIMATTLPARWKETSPSLITILEGLRWSE